MKKLLSFALALTLCILCTVPAFAAGSTALTQPGTNYPEYPPSHNYSRNWASTTKFYLFANASGGLTRVEAPNDGSPNQLRVEEYDSSFRFLSGRLLTYDGLPRWGGFYAGTNYNFIITGQNNLNESDSVEVIRVLKYSKDWQYLGKASVYGADTYMPFEAGSLSCAESGGVLYVYTCHEMYNHGDGKHHQSNMQITIRESDMNATEVTMFGNGYFNSYTSHSFNQFILVDSQGNLVMADHGDGGPRAMVINTLVGKAGNTKPNESIKDGDRMGWVLTDKFPGTAGDNKTGAMLGGLAETSNGYLLAFAQHPNHAAPDVFDPYQIKLAYVAKNSITMTVAGGGGGIENSFQTVKQLTNASSSMGNPFLVPTSLSGGYILWTSGDETISYATYDANGQTGTVQTASGKLSDCQPIAYNGKVVWFTVESGSAPTFYTLDAAGVTAVKANGTASAPSTPSTTAAPGPFKDVSATHWAANDIQTCVEKGIVKGYADGTFRPGNSITNAEFISMAAPIFFSQSSINEEAAKLGSGAPWYLPVMYAAQNMFRYNTSFGGDPSGWPSAANKPITRADAAIIGTYCFQSEGGPEGHGEIDRMTDLNQIDETVRWYIKDCLALGVMSGYPDNTFRPNGTLTRAEACAIVNRMARVYGM